MYKNKTMFRSKKPVFVRGSGLIPYKRVIRGDGVGEVFQKIVKSMGRVLGNPKLRESAKRIATKTGKKIFTDTLENKIVDTTSDFVNTKINKIIDGVNEGPSTELTPQEVLRAKARITKTIVNKGEDSLDTELPLYLQRLRAKQRRNKAQSGSGIKKRGRPRKKK